MPLGEAASQRLLLLAMCGYATRTTFNMAKPTFKGVIKLDIRDSKPDWAPYMPAKAPEGAPNVLLILYDDTGLAAWSPFGGRINMPTLQRAGRQRPDVLAMAYDGAVLANAFHAADRTQPPPERHVLRSPKAPAAFPAGTGAFPTSAPRWGRSCRTAAGARSGWASDHLVPETDVSTGAAESSGR